MTDYLVVISGDEASFSSDIYKIQASTLTEAKDLAKDWCRQNYTPPEKNDRPLNIKIEEDGLTPGFWFNADNFRGGYDVITVEVFDIPNIQTIAPSRYED